MHLHKGVHLHMARVHAGIGFVPLVHVLQLTVACPNFNQPTLPALSVHSPSCVECRRYPVQIPCPQAPSSCECTGAFVMCNRSVTMQDLHFIDAPHTLPQAADQQVPTRAWWRHWNTDQETEPDSTSSSTAAASTTCMTTSVDRDAEIQKMLAAGWEDIIIHDWNASLSTLQERWQYGADYKAKHGDGDLSSRSDCVQFDGILGFSNGAAAGFLLACHATAHRSMFSSLRFVILAGGYVPSPLLKLVPEQLLVEEPQRVHVAQVANSSQQQPSSSAALHSSSSSSSASNTALPVSTTNGHTNSPNGMDTSSSKPSLLHPLPFASLHIMGSNDPLIAPEVSMQLLHCFQDAGR